MYGVSPAWFLSLYGEDFSCKEAGDSLTLLKKLGFTYWQPEIFQEDKLKEWEGSSSKELHSQSRNLGLKVNHFIAHFLLHSFESESQLDSDWGISQCTEMLAVLEEWKEIKTVTVPLPGFSPGTSLDSKRYKKDYERTIEKLIEIAELIEKSGRICALEILPSSLIGGSEGFLRLRKVKGLEQLGVNLDTGHFNAMGERLDFTLGRISPYITGTHLCDNDGITNNSFEPGAGSVDWKAFQYWEASSPGLDSMDIEIRCPENEVEQRYNRGLDFMKSLKKIRKG